MLQSLPHQGYRKVGQADCARFALLAQFRKFPQRPFQRHVRTGPVHQKQIDIVRLQEAQALVHLERDVRLRRRLGMQELGRHPDVGARDRRTRQCLPDRLLVAVVPGCVDVAVAFSERRFDEGAAGIAGVAQRPEADTGHRVFPYEFFFHVSV